MDLVFGSDINADGWLVDEKDVGVRREPFPKADFLPVAAAEIADDARNIRSANDVPDKTSIS